MSEKYRERKRRCRNYTEEEIQHFLEIVQNNKYDVIRNKKCFHSVNRAKQEAWQEIAEQFNQYQVTGERTPTELQTLYFNKQRTSRQSLMEVYYDNTSNDFQNDTTQQSDSSESNENTRIKNSSIDNTKIKSQVDAVDSTNIKIDKSLSLSELMRHKEEALLKCAFVNLEAANIRKRRELIELEIAEERLKRLKSET